MHSSFQISLAQEDRRNVSALYNPLTVKELQQKYPYIQWQDYINALLPEHVQIDENERVIDNVPKFLKELESILKSTPKRTFANYFMWRIALQTIGTLTKELRQKRLDYFKIRIGLQSEEPRWKECAKLTSNA